MSKPSNDKRPFQYSLGRLMLLPVGVAFCFMINAWLGTAPAVVAAIIGGVLLIPSITITERLVVGAIAGILVALLQPAVQSSGGRDHARMRCCNHLKQIALAMHNYNDVHGSFPPAYIADEDGKPMHSWRVLILPYMEQQALHEQYNFNEPWDGPNNRLLHDTIVQAYACPCDVNSVRTITNYVLITGPGTAFVKDGSAKFADFADGMSNTLLVVETTGSDIHWMEPRDLAVERLHLSINAAEGMPRGISSVHPGGANVAIADGSVRFVSEEIPAKTLRGLLTIAGGEMVDWSD